MNDSEHFRLADGVDVVRMPDEGLLFRSNTLAVRVDGTMAETLERRILPLLREPVTLHGLTQALADISAEDLRRSLESLVRARVVARSHQPQRSRSTLPFDAFLTEVGGDATAAADRLRASCVAIFGLEAHGAHLAFHLARLGVGAVVLADRFPAAESDALLMPRGTHRVGVPRQDLLATALLAEHPGITVRRADELSRDTVTAIATDATILVGCFDRGYETAQHWINRAALATGKPALFAELRTHLALVGPFVIPNQCACYMCYRMRRIASEDNYDEAMAWERHLNEGREPHLSRRAAAPFLSEQLASALAGEIVKTLALGLPPTLAGRVHELDTLTLESRLHPVLQQPDCPVCGGKKNAKIRRDES